MSYGLLSRYSNIEDFTPSNAVIVCRYALGAQIDLSAAFLSLPILPIEEPISKKKKVKIPFYGVDDVIVSIRYKKEARGIRLVPKQPDNFVSIDLQTGHRNVHIKLSKQNALVMGVTSLKEGIDAVECLLDIAYVTDMNLEYLRKSSNTAIDDCLDFLETFGETLPDVDDYKAAVAKHNSSFEKLSLKDDQHLEEGKVLSLKEEALTLEHSLSSEEQKRSSLDEKQKESLEEKRIPSKPIDERLAMILLVRAYELNNMDKLISVISSLRQMGRIDPNNVEITETEVSNSAYNYKFQFYNLADPTIPVEGFFILKNLALKIIEIGNSSCIPSSHNWHSKYTNVVLSTYGMHDGKILMESNRTKEEEAFYRRHEDLVIIDNELTKNARQHIHRFNISETGSCRFWAPALKEEAYLVHLLLIRIIGEVLANTNDVYIIPEPF
jgi:hypothetical protein